MEIDIKTLELGTILKINGEDYEVISSEEDWWGDDERGVINRGEIVDLHKIGDPRMGVPTPTHFLYFDNDTKKLSFKENKIKPNPDIPKDVKLKGYVSEQVEIPIKEILIK